MRLAMVAALIELETVFRGDSLYLDQVQQPPSGLQQPASLPQVKTVLSSAWNWFHLQIAVGSLTEQHTVQVALYFRGLLSIRGRLVKMPSKRSLPEFLVRGQKKFGVNFGL